jgi:hypothetical protein
MFTPDLVFRSGILPSHTGHRLKTGLFWTEFTEAFFLAQASHRLLTAEVPVLFQATPFGIFGEQSGTDVNV